MEVGVKPKVFMAAIKQLLELEPLHLAIMVFGVSVVLILSVIMLWKHAGEERDWF
jgi:hypothetical protein